MSDLFLLQSSFLIFVKLELSWNVILFIWKTNVPFVIINTCTYLQVTPLLVLYSYDTNRFLFAYSLKDPHFFPPQERRPSRQSPSPKRRRSRSRSTERRKKGRDRRSRSRSRERRRRRRPRRSRSRGRRSRSRDRRPNRKLRDKRPSESGDKGDEKSVINNVQIT